MLVQLNAEPRPISGKNLNRKTGICRGISLFLGAAVLTCTHDLCIEQKYQKNQTFSGENFQFLQLNKIVCILHDQIFVMRQHNIGYILNGILWKSKSRQRSGNDAIRKKPIPKPRWEKTKLTIKYSCPADENTSEKTCP